MVRQKIARIIFAFVIGKQHAIDKAALLAVIVRSIDSIATLLAIVTLCPRQHDQSAISALNKFESKSNRLA